jgi:heme exporter protein A
MVRVSVTSDNHDNPHLRVHSLECRRGERVLFSGISFVVQPGQIVWLRGANGQGKTTLLRTLAGLSVQEAGPNRPLCTSPTPTP